MKTVVSPVKRWAGSVTLADPLTFPQWFAWQEAIKAAQFVMGSSETTPSSVDSLLLPGILACVAEWKLDKFPQTVTPETFPATPRKSSAQLVAWLVHEITAIASEDDDDFPK